MVSEDENEAYKGLQRAHHGVTLFARHRQDHPAPRYGTGGERLVRSQDVASPDARRELRRFQTE